MSHPEQLFCCFTIDGDQFLGVLNLDGDETNLCLNSRREIPYSPEPHSLFGESLDHKKISLFQCVGNSPDPEGIYPKFVFKRNTFPHYTLIGHEHFDEDDRVFMSVSFKADDLGLVLSKRGTFGVAQPAPEKLQEMLEGAFPARKIAIGRSPTVFFFSGDQDNLPIDVGIGMFSANLDFSSKVSNDAGISCPSETTARLDFKHAKTLNEVIDDVNSILHFLAVIAGRPQGVDNINVTTSESAPDEQAIPGGELSVYWSLAPRTGKAAVSSTRDMPVTPDSDSEQFFRVFGNWLRRHDEWMLARLRILNWQKNGREYDENRLVAAANAFDILPASTYSEDLSKLSDEAVEARKQCKKIMRALKTGPERDQILGTLQFWGGRSLKNKILNKTKVIHDAFGEHFADLDCVVIVAVLARNYFVHGTDSFGYKHYDTLMPFLIDTLEFVFVASDLIECGWDAKRWAERRPVYSHHLASYFSTYKLEILKFYAAQQEAEKDKGNEDKN